MAKTNKVNTGIRSLLSTPAAPMKPTKATPTPAQSDATAPPRTDKRRSADKTVMVATGLRTSEKDEITAIAKAEDIAVNALLAFIVRDGVKRYRDGKLKLPKTTVTKLDY